MIISKTPHRVSFLGGATDIPTFYNKGFGAVVSTTIDKYIYVIISKKWDNQIRLSYHTNNEIVDNVNQIKHEIIRECLKWVKIKKGIEILTISDLPGSSGLGSSSALTVGLLTALYKLKKIKKSQTEIAKEACIIELEKLKKPIGKQDQYSTAIGGLNLITFTKDKITVINIKDILKLNQDYFLLFYINSAEKRDKILKEVIKEEFILADIRNLTFNIFTTKFEELLQKYWELKKSTSSSISNRRINYYYNEAIKNGALAGKICGAGSAGFLLMYVKKRKKEVRRALKNLREMDFRFEERGTRIILK